jgi:regulator of RNase E activity RraA
VHRKRALPSAAFRAIASAAAELIPAQRAHRYRRCFGPRRKTAMNAALMAQLQGLTGPHLADGCLRSGIPIRFAPPEVRPLAASMACRGRALPVRHVGSIDVFLEVLDHARPGDVMVIDNGGRQDEACIGDIVLLEAQAAGIAGFVIWGLHRDSSELAQIGLPVFSMGALPTGPQRLHARPPDVFQRAGVGQHSITAADIVAADANGVLFLPSAQLDDIVAAATAYRETEARQLQAMREGRSYREQTKFGEYLRKRDAHPAVGFRQHLKDIEAAGEV